MAISGNLNSSRAECICCGLRVSRALTLERAQQLSSSPLSRLGRAPDDWHVHPSRIFEEEGPLTSGAAGKLFVSSGCGTNSSTGDNRKKFAPSFPLSFPTHFRLHFRFVFRFHFHFHFRFHFRSISASISASISTFISAFIPAFSSGPFLLLFPLSFPVHASFHIRSISGSFPLPYPLSFPVHFRRSQRISPFICLFPENFDPFPVHCPFWQKSVQLSILIRD